MKIDTLEKLNEFLKERMKEQDILSGNFEVYQNTPDSSIRVHINAVRVSTEFIVFLGNCLKKYEQKMLYSEAPF